MPFALKKLWSLVTAVLLLAAAAADRPQGEPEGARLTGSRTYLLFEALTRGQGIATDGEFFYFSGNYFLNKTDIETNKTVAENPLAIPPALLLKGGNHIGGISYYNGTIYAPIEDGPDYLHPYIALYDAGTLRYTGVCYELPRGLHIEGVPWCAVDAERGYLYTAEWSNAKALNVFSLTDMSLVKTVPLSMTLDRIQGAVMYGGTLYLSDDVGTKTVYSLNPVTGEAAVAFRRNVNPENEAESMTVLSTPGGPVFYVMDIGPKRFNVTLREYVLDTAA